MKVGWQKICWHLGKPEVCCNSERELWAAGRLPSGYGTERAPYNERCWCAVAADEANGSLGELCFWHFGSGSFEMQQVLADVEFVKKCSTTETRSWAFHQCFSSPDGTGQAEACRAMEYRTQQKRISHPDGHDQSKTHCRWHGGDLCSRCSFNETSKPRTMVQRSLHPVLYCSHYACIRHHLGSCPVCRTLSPWFCTPWWCCCHR